MKSIHWVGWISLVIAVVIMLFGGIFMITRVEMFGIKHLVNYFHAASTFLLLTIALFIYAYRCECKR